MTSVYNRFSERDDNKLKELVRQYGENNWKKIASKMPGRNKRQCRDRWFRYLSPTVNHNPWSKQEDDLLMELVTKTYPKWREISKFFEGRNDIQIKNRYKVITNRNKNNQAKLIDDFDQPDLINPFAFNETFNNLDSIYYSD